MRDPINQKKIYFNDQDEVLVINNLPDFDIEEYDLYNEKDKKKYISDLERLCRQSYEYKELISFLRDYLNMNKCSFYENVNNIDTHKIKIHIHHEPLTLYDICATILEKRITLREPLDIELVCEEVLYVHYCLIIGLIPLAETPHELVHNQYLFVPADKVLGNYSKFIEIYEPYMSNENKYILNQILEATKVYNGYDTGVLNTKYIYVDTSGAYKLPSLEDMRKMMSGTINDIKASMSGIKNNDYNNIKLSPISFIR